MYNGTACGTHTKGLVRGSTMFEKVHQNKMILPDNNIYLTQLDNLWHVHVATKAWYIHLFVMFEWFYFHLYLYV